MNQCILVNDVGSSYLVVFPQDPQDRLKVDWNGVDLNEARHGKVIVIANWRHCAVAWMDDYVVSQMMMIFWLFCYDVMM